MSSWLLSVFYFPFLMFENFCVKLFGVSTRCGFDCFRRFFSWWYLKNNFGREMMTFEKLNVNWKKKKKVDEAITETLISLIGTIVPFVRAQNISKSLYDRMIIFCFFRSLSFSIYFPNKILIFFFYFVIRSYQMHKQRSFYN